MPSAEPSPTAASISAWVSPTTMPTSVTPGGAQRLEPVEEDRLVGHGDELLGARVGDRPQARPRAAGEHQSLEWGGHGRDPTSRPVGGRARRPRRYAFRCVDRDEWLARRTYRGADFDPERLADRARREDLRISVCLPALNVADTVGPIVATAARAPDRARPRSSPRSWSWTAAAATARRAVGRGGGRAGDPGPRDPAPAWRPGAARARRCGRASPCSSGDIVVWLDSDVVDFDPAFVTGLVGPLLDRPRGGLRQGPLPARRSATTTRAAGASPRSARGP